MRSRRMWALCLTSLLAVLATGCGSHGGNLTLTSQHEEHGAELVGRFSTGLYRYDDNNQITMLLVDGPLKAPTQAVTVRMFWTPRAGRTPIDRTATNATIHYIIFTGNQAATKDEAGAGDAGTAGDVAQVGIYSGAGFLFPHGSPGDGTLSASVWQSTLRLIDATDHFQDLLGPSSLHGDITIRHDDVALEQALRLLHIRLRETLGFPRLVEATVTTPAMPITPDAALHITR